MNIEERQAIAGRNLLLFDGLCAMCNRTIRFLIRRDSAGRLIYAPLESPLGQEMLAHTVLLPDAGSDILPRWNSDGIVLIESALTPEQRVSTKSDATGRTLLLLPGAWPWLGRLLSWVPRGLREWAYRLVARWRYRIFDTYTVCPTPSARERSLILGATAGSTD